jgi:RNA polymerase-binding protein
MPALRGFTLNSHSYESDENVVPVETVPHSYHCPAGHCTTLRFAHDAEEIPDVWDCPKCGRLAHEDQTAARRVAATDQGLALFSPRSASSGKTHWDMLLERRTLPELEALLEERLRVLRSRKA